MTKKFVNGNLNFKCLIFVGLVKFQIIWVDKGDLLVRSFCGENILEYKILPLQIESYGGQTHGQANIFETQRFSNLVIILVRI
jgi:hypothetical protein